MKKQFAYNDVDGDHFPDGEVGDELEYGIDFKCYLDDTNGELVTPAAVWTVPKGVDIIGAPFVFDNVAFITLKPLYPSSFSIRLQIHTEEDIGGGTTGNIIKEVKSFKRILKVR